MKTRAAALLVVALLSACTSSRPGDDGATLATDSIEREATGKGVAPRAVGSDVVNDDGASPGSVGEASAPRSGGNGSVSPRDETPVPSTTQEVRLFTDDEDRVGITDDTIRTCAHAQIYLGRAFDIEPADTTVFWSWLKDHGGIHGRTVDEKLVEDGGGRLVAQAYEECRGTFLLRGGPTMDAVPTMREVVEADPHRPLYFHFMARADETKRYSFSAYPTQEQVGVLFARLILERHAGKKIGIIHRDSDGWMPGHDTFVQTIEAAGGEIVADIAQASGDSVYAGALARLHEEGAEVVWAWIDAIASAHVIKESRSQRYGFRWVIGFPSNLLTGVLGDDALEPEPVSGVTMWPAYTPGLRDGPFAAHADEFERFETAYREYRGKDVPAKASDILFFKWVEDRNLAALLERCGPDCGRNRILALLASDEWHAIDPACPFSFGTRHAGGRAATIVEAFRSPRGVAWRDVDHCAPAR